MKYLLVSDIHGSLPALERVLHVFEQTHCDLLCLLGDILNYGPRNGLPEGLDPQGIVQRLKPYADRIVAVRGNCDSEVDQMLLPFPIMSDYALLVDEGKRLFLTHGHVWNPEKMPALGVDFFVYGHTHLPYVQEGKDGRPALGGEDEDLVVKHVDFQGLDVFLGVRVLLAFQEPPYPLKVLLRAGAGA